MSYRQEIVGGVLFTGAPCILHSVNKSAVRCVRSFEHVLSLVLSAARSDLHSSPFFYILSPSSSRSSSVVARTVVLVVSLIIMSTVRTHEDKASKDKNLALAR